MMMTFPKIGVDFEVTGAATVGVVGAGCAQLFRQRRAVDLVECSLRERKGWSPQRG
jgi:hypothetical protein